MPRPDSPDPVAFTDPQTQEVLEALLRERLDEEDYRAFKSIIGPSDPQYYEAAYGELAARVKIPESRLQELAASRAQAIADAVAAAGIAPDRIVSTEVRQVNEQPDSSIATKLDLDASAAG